MLACRLGPRCTGNDELPARNGAEAFSTAERCACARNPALAGGFGGLRQRVSNSSALGGTDTTCWPPGAKHGCVYSAGGEMLSEKRVAGKRLGGGGAGATERTTKSGMIGMDSLCGSGGRLFLGGLFFDDPEIPAGAASRGVGLACRRKWTKAMERSTALRAEVNGSAECGLGPRGPLRKPLTGSSAPSTPCCAGTRKSIFSCRRATGMRGFSRRRRRADQVPENASDAVSGLKGFSTRNQLRALPDPSCGSW